jgi:predicted transcriptional regulator
MAMTLRLSDEDDEALTRQAEREGVSKQTVAQRAIRLYVEEQDLADDVDQALDVLTPRYQGLLDRLGSV